MFALRFEPWPLTTGGVTLSHRRYSLIGFRESQLPQNSSSRCLQFFIEMLSRRFCGKVDYLKLIYEYIM